jgi:hypothetical protein
MVSPNLSLDIKSYFDISPIIKRAYLECVNSVKDISILPAVLIVSIVFFARKSGTNLSMESIPLASLIIMMYAIVAIRYISF